MILQNEIKQKARENGVPVSTIERDYAQNWLLMALSPLPVLLKGGTGIRKIYIENYRFSDDLDFTLLKKIDNEELNILIENALERAKEESGINFSMDENIREITNGFELNIYFQIMQRGENKTAIKIDITKYENENILLPINTKHINHPYSDKLNAEIKVYSLEEILAEKIRSIFQRTRPRDLYDVWYLWDKIEQKKVFEIILAKFKAKNIEISFKDIEKRKDDFKNSWESSLRHQLKTLPEFEKVFLTVFEEIKFVLKK
ncbi:MAG TPA: nucleotidyl transferase AbiEii/AbiGii toxin family protein [Candidatus Ratteibacteria bacterium]|nr:nucleotidyl transferase AbiEii/AbiGii toxin family protein [Candidatus Ratteibacteria bacterium]